MPKSNTVRYIPMATKSFTGGIVDFISWWYRNIPLWILRLFKRVALICDDSFSISLLIRTFFVPWHRDYSITGRIVGIIVRLVYLPIVLFITAILLSIVLVFLIIWTTLPIIFIYTIVNTIQN